MPPYLPTEILLLIFFHNSSLSMFLQRGACKHFKAVIEQVFIQRHTPDIKQMSLTFPLGPTDEIPANLNFEYLELSSNKRVATFTRGDRDSGWLLYYRAVLRCVALQGNIILYHSDKMSVAEIARVFYVVRLQNRRGWYNSREIPLFRLEARLDSLEVEFEWMPTFAAILREKEARRKATVGKMLYTTGKAGKMLARSVCNKGCQE